MPRGGKREGAGRKPGSKNRKTREREALVAAGGTTPLAVMLDCMARHLKARRWAQAAEVARHAAPYVHSRLASVAHSGTVGVRLSLVEEIVDADRPSDDPATPGPGALPQV